MLFQYLFKRKNCLIFTRKKSNFVLLILISILYFVNDSQNVDCNKRNVEDYYYHASDNAIASKEVETQKHTNKDVNYELNDYKS